MFSPTYYISDAKETGKVAFGCLTVLKMHQPSQCPGVVYVVRDLCLEVINCLGNQS